MMDGAIGSSSPQVHTPLESGVPVTGAHPLNNDEVDDVARDAVGCNALESKVGEVEQEVCGNVHEYENAGDKNALIQNNLSEEMLDKIPNAILDGANTKNIVSDGSSDTRSGGDAIPGPDTSDQAVTTKLPLGASTEPDACPGAKEEPIIQSVESPNNDSMINPVKDSEPNNTPVDEGNRIKDGSEYNQTNNSHNAEKARSVRLDHGEEDEGGEGDFVAIELASPKESHQTTAMNHPAPPNEFAPNNPDAKQHAGNNEFVEETMEIPQPTTAAHTTNKNNINSTSSPPPATGAARRKRILRHPILTPLTKLPWDRFASAAGACDLLFNCKYSMRQVEDEVREDAKRLGRGREVNLLKNGGEECNSIEEGRVGREDGYVNLSLGNECGDYHHYGEQGCEADEFAELGLSCCSMLDQETDDEMEVVASGRLLQHQEQQHQQNIESSAEENSDQALDESDEHRVQTASPTQVPSPILMTDDQKAEISWKSSNPSLDMMFYRKMLNE